MVVIIGEEDQGLVIGPSVWKAALMDPPKSSILDEIFAPLTIHCVGFWLIWGAVLTASALTTDS